MNTQYSSDGKIIDEPKPKFFVRVERHLLKTIASGFVILFPLFVTIIIIVAIFGYVHGAFGAGVLWAEHFLAEFFGIQGPWVETAINIAGPVISMGILLALLYIFGALITFNTGRKVVQAKQTLMKNLPVMKSIYKVADQVVDSVVAQRDGHHFSRVVFVEWPRAGYLAIGFITAHIYSNEMHDKPLMVVYIPTVPNPTSGNLAYVAEDDVIETDLTVEEAMKIVFSGGMVHPDRMRVGVEEADEREKAPALAD